MFAKFCFLALAPLVSLSTSLADTSVPIVFNAEWERYQEIAGEDMRVLRLPQDVDDNLQMYFRDEIWSKIALPGEDVASMPKIVLFSSLNRTMLAFVNTDHKDLIFWHAGFLAGSPSVDVDRYVAAHELRHTMNENTWSTRRLQEFDADASTGQRLIRFGLRDAQGKPEPAVVHIASFVRWLKKSRGYTENYIDGNALATAAVLAFGRERIKREFPKHATKRDGVADVRQWVIREARRNQWLDLRIAIDRFDLEKAWQALIATIIVPFAVPVAVFGMGYDRVVAKAQRLNGSIVTALGRFERMRVEYMDTGEVKPGGALAHEFLHTFSVIQRLVREKPTGKFLSRLFVEFSKLPPDLFGVWAPLTRSLFRWSSMNATVFDPETAHHRFDFVEKLESESGADGLFDPTKSFYLDDEGVIFGSSRAMAHFVADADARKLKDRPLAALAYLAIAGSTERMFEHWGVRPPRLVGQFRAALTRAIADSFAPETLGDALINDVTRYADQRLMDHTSTSHAYALGQARLPQTFPELARVLNARMPDNRAFSRWRFELSDKRDAVDFLSNASVDSPVDFLSMLYSIGRDRHIVVDRNKLVQLWYGFLERNEGQPYVRGMDEVFDLDSPFDHFSIFKVHRDIDLLNLQAHAWDALEFRIGAALTARVARDWRAFFGEWSKDGIDPGSAILGLVDWSSVFSKFTADDLAHLFARYPDALTSDRVGWAKLREAVLDRLLVFSADITSPSALRTTLAGLNLLSSSSTTGQKILKNLLRQMTADDSLSGAVNLLEFLRSVRIINFPRLEEFITLYVDAMVRIAGGDEAFSKIPMDRLREELIDVKHRFEPQLASRILSKLAERYRADLNDKAEFELNLAQNIFVGHDWSQLWSDLIASIAPESATELAFLLRENKPVSRDARTGMQLILARYGFYVPSDEVESKVRSIFAHVGPVRQMSFLADPEAEVRRVEPAKISPREQHLVESLAEALTEREGQEIVEMYIDMLKPISRRARSERQERERKKYHQRGANAAEDFQILYELAKKLKSRQTLNFIETLRSGAKLDDELREELQLHLTKARVLVQSSAVEDYLSQRFRELQPYERAGLLKLILDASNNMLDTYRFRKQVFATLLKSFPDRETRDTFIDLWGAGMRALPKSLHSLVLGVVLAESGKVGSPETALVTLLSSMSSLEQKFGQALAFADLPESYRQALRDLWDGAQKLDWFGAWELILVQHGDIREAGFRLNRILNSGSTAAYLEIVHDDGRRFALPVYRDGIEQGVKIGRDQLRIFARDVARRSPKRYGFLPLLVEDAVRTMEFELDPMHKERMTNEMAALYRAAGQRLGWRADGGKIVDGDGWTYTHLEYHSIDLGGGKTVRVQDVADGVGLRRLEKLDPELYRTLTAKILELENGVNDGSWGPVDKDRMPGQFMVNVDTKTVYILDHGQAATLSPKIRAQFIEFTKLGFAADVGGMSRLTEELTGMKPRGYDLGNRVRSADASVRPFVFLNEISADFLKLDPKDSRAERFFELLHGVRAQLRLYQWEISEGHSRFTDAVKEEIMANTDHRTLAWRTALGWISRETSELWRKVKSWVIPAKWRMEYAYRRASLFDCEEALGTVK